jgi:hypothetical protein
MPTPLSSCQDNVIPENLKFRKLPAKIIHQILHAIMMDIDLDVDVRVCLSLLRA